MVVAAPLLVLGRPLIPFLWALPISWRRHLGAWGARPPVRDARSILARPLVAVLLQGVALWGWHLPRAYEASLASDGVHALQHASFLITALLFWWSLTYHRGDHAHYGVSVLALFGTMMLTGVLGALITFSRTLWYPAYHDSPAVWGFTPLEDQQLAGLIMWIPGSASYVIAALTCLARWLRTSEQRAVASETGAAATTLATRRDTGGGGHPPRPLPDGS
jgi:putative membrane protein